MKWSGPENIQDAAFAPVPRPWPTSHSSKHGLERQTSWLSTALSSGDLPFALMDIEEEDRRKSLRALVFSIGSCALYAVCAVSMNFTNKAALMVFPYANVLLFLQMITVLVAILPLRAVGLVKFPGLSVNKARKLLPITILYAGNVSCALLGLRVLNVPMYSTLKRLTPMMVLLTKWRMTKVVPSRGIIGSVAVVVIGCFVAGAGDLAFDVRGYTFALASCMLQAAYLLLVEFSGAKQGVTTSELLIYNAMLSLPFILAVTVLSGEAFEAITALGAIVQDTGAMHVSLLLIVCSISGVALNFSMFLCTSLNSALTTTIVGTLKGVVATVLGFFLLGGVELHALNVVGIALNAIGGATYSVVKYRARSSKPTIGAVSAPGSGSSSPGKPPLPPLPLSGVNTPPLSPWRNSAMTNRNRMSPALSPAGGYISGMAAFERALPMELLGKA